MEIELKRIEYSERMSEETSCFCADVYADGVKLGTAQNAGHGGETLLRGDFKALREYAETLPPIAISLGECSFDHKQTAEDLVEDALHRHLCRKDMRKCMKKHTLFVRDGKLYQANPGITKMADNCILLNTLPEDAALALYMKYGGAA